MTGKAALGVPAGAVSVIREGRGSSYVWRRFPRGGPRVAQDAADSRTDGRQGGGREEVGGWGVGGAGVNSPGIVGESSRNGCLVCALQV